ncbi:hypothetical protein PEX1_084290 [Penicillium expansum]|nr:hypothetical protein PEX1_084290 [Penicillium expansum]
MGMEWATKNIILSICTPITKYGHHHHHHHHHHLRHLDTNLRTLCNNLIHHHNHNHLHHRLDTNILILCLLILLSTLIRIPFTHNLPENQIVHQLPNLIHVL